jgi:NADPH:quinone reductase-like Zn-dependent oxidoreductase
VLIHSACGGIGIAAIQICRAIGAEIFATVGTDEKVEYLVETYGIPRSRIFSSRNSEFLPGILRETGGKGVDVVLNSLSGELLHASVCPASPLQGFTPLAFPFKSLSKV